MKNGIGVLLKVRVALAVFIISFTVNACAGSKVSKAKTHNQPYLVKFKK